MSRRIWSVLAVFATLAAVPVSAQSTVAQLWEQKLHQKVKALDDGLNGVLGVAFIDLTSGHVFSYNGDTSFPTASSIKIPILIQMFRDEKTGRVHFSDRVTLGAK
ncbi:MAG: serine hydrolase, partial [Bryobacteraceae bacterium]